MYSGTWLFKKFRSSVIDVSVSVDGEVSDQPLLPCVFPADHNGLLHRRVPAQGSFDLPQFNPEPTNLDLVINAAQKLNVAIRQITRQVTRPVQPFSLCLSKRVGNKPLRRQVGTIQVPRANPSPPTNISPGMPTGTACPSLRRYTCRSGIGLPMTTAGGQVSLAQWTVGDMDCCLGNTIHVD